MQERKKKILIIDDEPDHLYVARELLSAEGYETLTHPTPFGVIGLISEVKPDLILMDVSMPGFPGTDLAAYLRADARTRDVPVVLYSSCEEKELSLAVAMHSLAGFIRKGDVSELRRKVAYFLGDLARDAVAFGKSLYAVD